MVSSNDFKNGMTILYDGNIYKIMEFMHVKPGKGAAFVRTKLRNLRSGAIVDITFQNAERVTLADIVKFKSQYLYDTGDALCFMDTETYEQTEIPYNLVSEERKFLRFFEGLVFILFFLYISIFDFLKALFFGFVSKFFFKVFISFWVDIFESYINNGISLSIIFLFNFNID